MFLMSQLRRAERRSAAERTRHRMNHGRVMRNAAALPALRVTCHVDVLDAIARAADVGLNWLEPEHPWHGRVTRDGDTVTADLSGVYLAKALDGLDSLWHVIGPSDADRAICERLYAVLSGAVDTAGPQPGTAPEVTIDRSGWEAPH